MDIENSFNNQIKLFSTNSTIFLLNMSLGTSALIIKCFYHSFLKIIWCNPKYACVTIQADIKKRYYILFSMCVHAFVCERMCVCVARSLIVHPALPEWAQSCRGWWWVHVLLRGIPLETKHTAGRILGRITTNCHMNWKVKYNLRTYQSRHSEDSVDLMATTLVPYFHVMWIAMSNSFQIPPHRCLGGIAACAVGFPL